MIKNRCWALLIIGVVVLALPVHSQKPPTRCIAPEPVSSSAVSTRADESPEKIWEGAPALTSRINASSLTYGICKTICSGFIMVTWQAASYQECCQGSAYVCPEGTTPKGANYTPPSGPAVKCESIG